MAKDKEKPKDEEEKDDKAAKKDKDKEDGGEGEAAEGEGGKKGLKGLLKNKKKLIIIIAALVILLAGGGGAAFFFLKGGKSEAPAEGEGTEAEAGHDAPKEGEGHGDKAEAAKDEHGNPVQTAPIPGAPIYYNMPEILVNLNTSGNKQTTLLKVAVTLELAKQQDVPVIDANLPRIQDSFNTYLREMRASDLSGSAGIYRLREELLLRINKIISPAKVNDILFKNILVQ